MRQAIPLMVLAVLLIAAPVSSQSNQIEFPGNNTPLRCTDIGVISSGPDVLTDPDFGLFGTHICQFSSGGLADVYFYIVPASASAVQKCKEKPRGRTRTKCILKAVNKSTAETFIFIPPSSTD